MTISDINFHTSDLKSMIKLMKHHADFPMALNGVNKDGEDYIVSINEHNIIIETFQNNHWTRQDIYWDDGTVEQMFEGRWK